MQKIHVPEPYENTRGLLTVCTRAVALKLTSQEIGEVFLELRRKMAKQDPDNPDLWSTEIRGQRIWGILDRRAGPRGEDLFTSDY